MLGDVSKWVLYSVREDQHNFSNFKGGHWNYEKPQGGFWNYTQGQSGSFLFSLLTVEIVVLIPRIIACPIATGCLHFLFNSTASFSHLRTRYHHVLGLTISFHLPWDLGFKKADN